MPRPASARRPILVVLVIAILAIGGVGLFFLLRRPSTNQSAALPDPSSPAYQQYVTDFETGVAALDVAAPPQKPDPTRPQETGIGDLAFQHLNECVKSIPGEPAGWANRGLWYMRQNRLKEAGGDLGEAEKLAGDRPEIQRLLGYLDRKNGHPEEAARHFREALARDPNDLPTLYALSQTVEEGGAGNDAEILKLLNQGLAIQPNNLRLLREKGKVAARLGDRQALGEVVLAYRRLAPDWQGLGARDARRELDELERQVANPNPDEISLTINKLDNNLQIEYTYVRDARAVQPDAAQEGEPVEQFLRLTPMRATPSPPDTAMAFEASAPPGQIAAPVGSARWDVALPVWLTQDAEPVIFVASAKEVRRASGDAPPLSFPHGKEDVAPTASGVLPFDWNNDFRTDLLLAGAGGLRFYQQGDGGTFTDVTGKTGLDAATLGASYFGAWAADMEMDGDLDVIAAPHEGPPVVLRNNGDGTFKLIKPFAGVQSVRGFVWADFDNDGAPDAALLDEQGKVHVFTNQRSGQFQERTVPDMGKCLALAVANVTDDSLLSLLALRDDGVILRLTDKDKGQSWEVKALARWPEFVPGESPGSFRLLTADLDNNGGIDLIASGPMGSRVWLSNEDGRFEPLETRIDERVFAAVDLNGDHRLDLLALSQANQPIQRLNHGTKDYHWQVIRPRARDRRQEQVSADNRINSFGIGGEAEIRAGLLVQKQVIASPVIHFGLGEHPLAAVARIVWPNGGFQVEFDLSGDRSVIVLQRLLGSCPFLFTWDGSHMQFVADFMWGTPLGMYVNAQAKGGFLQTEERVKIRGDQLVPRDGCYDVRVTADLWETHFFDHLSLIVVDHPEDTDIFVDERFALAPTTPAIPVMTPPRPVARAVDDRGTDVTDIVRDIDGRYLDTFGRGLFQGVTRDHYVEVDLGDDAPTTGPVWLLASGWIHPTDSSLNVAIEQGSHDRPRPLTLEVPDGHGGWKTVRDDLGFPAGKNKTILIRLDGLGGNAAVARHVRLRTNMEIYWDALRYAVGLDESRARQQRLNPATAELRFRGISLITRANESSPELPDYDTLVSRTQYWRDLLGLYTRYGDVRELLAKADDRYVIMNAGDEMALTFRAPDGPHPGWKRDFVWVSDGWTKDGNLNTRFSKTVLPLPAHELQSYDHPPGRLEDDPVYQRFPGDWRKYHTRRVTTDIFEQGLRAFHRPRP